MRNKYPTTRTIEIALDGKSVELVASIEFTIAPYVPERGPSYASGGQPAEGGHVEEVFLTDVTLAGKSVDLPSWLWAWIEANVDTDGFYEEVMESEANDRERAADDRYEMQREDRLYYAASFAED